MMQQYSEIKEQYRDAILFFRLGDFYEMFFEDALKASKILKITLTSREVGKGKKIPMCGVPFHSAGSYIAKLIENGFKVAICEQVSDPSESRGLVKREVIKVITPGTVIDSEMLDANTNNYIVSLVFFGNNYGLSFADVSTGCLKVTEFDVNGKDKLFSEVIRLHPSEFVVSENLTNFKIWNNIRERFPKSLVNIIPLKKNSYQFYRETLTKHFNVISLRSFGCEHMNAGIVAAGVLLNYLHNVQKASLRHFLKIVPYQTEAYMMLDPATRKHLELTASKTENEYYTLQNVLDKTKTAMGSRFLKNMIELPLMDEKEINLRLEAVEEFKNNALTRKKLASLFSYVYDLERLISKISYGNATPKDLINLKESLKQLPEIKSCISQCSSRKINFLNKNLQELPEVVKVIENAIVDDPPSSVGEGNIFKPGYSSEIDELRDILKNSKQWILNLEQNERERTGIKSLKIKFNKVFGYFIEVTKANLDAVPHDYIRKQTLVNCERFITKELKDYENTVFSAEERLSRLEIEIFNNLKNFISKDMGQIQQTANALAELDALCSLGEAAAVYNYVKPNISKEYKSIKIVKGRHPVVERAVGEENFVPNDLELNCEDQKIIILTGPNMSGKSTYLRQNALICIMAQMGSLVPAESAELPIIDKIFTRIGAADDIATGQSTFLVEMNEVSNIINNATPRSLVLLDEVGRGTSTYDGLSLAWAIIEYIASKNKSKTLFATHYHELTAMERLLPGVKNFNVTAQEKDDGIVFLHKVVPGGTDKSYGIQVARLAGLPQEVIKRAEEILIRLEEKSFNTNALKISEKKKDFDVKEDKWKDIKELLEEIEKLDLLNITPLQAISALDELQKKVRSLKVLG